MLFVGLTFWPITMADWVGFDYRSLTHGVEDIQSLGIVMFPFAVLVLIYYLGRREWKRQSRESVTKRVRDGY